MGQCGARTAIIGGAAVRFGRHRVLSRNRVRDPILTFPELPCVDVTLLDHPGEEASGARVAAQGPTPDAIGNAPARATENPTRDLPLSLERVKRALG